MKEFLLVLLGAIISCGTTWFLDFLRYRREEKIYYKRKKEETYIKMQKLITDFMGRWNEVKQGHICKELRIKYNDIRPEAHIYANQSITDEFYNFVNDLLKGVNKDGYNKRNDFLIEAIRKDLKIKD